MKDTWKTSISTTKETPTTWVRRLSFDYRFAYARSIDSRNEGETGQDYLVINENDGRLSFALCDGVSQSFYGDIAARMLGEEVAKSLFSLNLEKNLDELNQEINSLLFSLTLPASNIVQEYKIPENLPSMLLKVLDQKRIQGSESTLAAGVADFDSGKIVLVWLGDSNIRIWGSDRELTANLGDTFLTDERWSSRKGPVGQVHVFTGSMRFINRITAYSDGLNSISERLRFEVLSNTEIDEEINKAGEDDISFFEIKIKKYFSEEKEKLGIPIDLHGRKTSTGLEFTWLVCAGASSYEVQLLSQKGDAFYRHTIVPSINLLQGEFPPDLKSVRVRALKDDEVGEWSESIIYKPQTPGPSQDNSPKKLKFVWILALACLAAVILFFLGFLTGIKFANNRVTPTTLFSITMPAITTPVAPTVTNTNTPTVTRTVIPITPTATNAYIPTFTSTFTPITPTTALSSEPVP